MVNTARRSVFPDIPAPEPLTQIKVRRADEPKIWFHATQAAVREIRRRGFGILGERQESGWCCLVVNECFDFNAVLAWLVQIQSPEVRSDVEDILSG